MPKTDTPAPVLTGLENLLADPACWIRGERLGLLCNPVSVDRDFRHARLRISQAFPGQLKALFSPQHGFFAEKQDNMIESDDIRDPLSGLPVFSLYGKTRCPTRKMFNLIDTLLVDLQDVGTRVYTFIYTLSYCMEAAKAYHKKMLVLDRPNPLGGSVCEGNILKPECASFVGRYPIPMRHGLTIGEMALLMNEAFGIGCDLEVVPMTGWQRGMFFTDTQLPWVPPSPNLPSPAAAVVYPGQVIWEGTNISEGRGTTQPFEIFGAPFIEPEKILSYLGTNRLPGAILRPILFEPTSNKWAETPCRGFQIHVTAPQQYAPYRTSLLLLHAMIALFRDHFQWKPPPYEYEHERLPIDLILGDQALRKQLENLKQIETIVASWQKELDAYRSLSRTYWRYPD